MAFCAAALTAQERVAVLPPLAGKNVSEINKKTVRSAFLDYISEPGSGFTAFDRYSIDMMIQREPAGQPNMLYDEKAARDIGRKLGVPLVCIIDLTRDERDFLIECKLVSVESGLARSKSEVVSGVTNAEIKKASEALVRKLMVKSMAAPPSISAAARPTATDSPATSRAAAPDHAAASSPATGRASAPSSAATNRPPAYNAPATRTARPADRPPSGDRLKWGVGLHIANPSGDITNNKELLGEDLYLKAKMGLGLSAFAEMALNGKMALRGRLDYNLFGEDKKKEEWYGYTYTDTFNANAATVFADFIYSFDSHENGLYAFAGLGFVSAKVKWGWKESSSYGSDSDSYSASGSNLGFSLGLGYNFNRHVGLEASYVAASNAITEKKEYTGADRDLKYGYASMQLSFKCRF
jgi:opacity protein-like surface antigen